MSIWSLMKDLSLVVFVDFFISHPYFEVVFCVNLYESGQFVTSHVY